jgi:flagellar basal-body rod modification protein FlgD
MSAALMAAMNGTQSASSASASDASSIQNRFMTLLVTQMKNQDPLNPMDNSQMTSQLAQLSTVTGVDKLNTTLQSLMGAYQSSQSMQAAGMIGHGVLIPGSSMDLSNGSAVFGVDLPGPADSVTVTIRDAGGNVVHSMDLGSQESGTHPLQWDGVADNGKAAPDGKYTFDVQAKLAGQSTTATALSFGQVGSVSTSSQGVKINVPSIGTVNFSDIRQIL